MQMTVRFTFQPLSIPFIVPVHYNKLLQAFIYTHLDSSLAKRLHFKGWLQDGKRRLPFFVFSRLQGGFKLKRNCLVSNSPIKFFVASPIESILESLVSNLVRTKICALGNSLVELISVEIDFPNALHRPLLLKAQSPITVYSTLLTFDGRKKTYYYTPHESDFERLVLENLRRKVRILTGEDLPLEGARFKPVKVSTRNLVIAKYKETVVKGWTGIYELDAPEPYLRMALNAGVGAKNSQGFGFVSIWNQQRNRIKCFPHS